MNINAWIALRQSAVDVLRPLLDDETYNGPHLTAVRIFRRMTDIATVENMFLTPTLGGNVYRLFSVNFNDINRNAATRVQEAFDHLESNYPAQFEVVGAWHWDGRQIGTQWELDGEGNRTGNTTGTPTYPLHARTVDFMPNGVLEDVNLIQGQSPRRFT